MISSFARHLYNTLKTQEPENDPAELKIKKNLSLELDFINYLGNKKILDDSYDQNPEFKEPLFQWFLDIKSELNHPPKSIQEIHDSLNIFWVFISRIWQTPGFTPFKINNLNDLKRILALEKKFHATVLTTIVSGNETHIQKMVKKGLLALSDGIYHPTFKASPVFLCLTFFFNIADPLRNINGSPDMKDLKIMLEYYFHKTGYMYQNFDLKAPIERYYQLLVADFSSFMQENELLQTYRNTISSINDNVLEIKLHQIQIKLAKEQEERKAEEQKLLRKKLVNEQSSFIKNELQDRNLISTEADKDFAKIAENHYLTIAAKAAEDLQKSEADLFLTLNEDAFLKIKTIQAEKISSKLLEYFEKTFKNMKDLPARLEDLKSLEIKERRKLISELNLELKNSNPQIELALQALKIKVLNNRRFYSLGNYFGQKIKYETEKFLPFDLKISILKESEAMSRKDMQDLQPEAVIDVLIDLLFSKESILRKKIEQDSKFHVKKVHAPYGGSPLKMIKASAFWVQSKKALL